MIRWWRIHGVFVADFRVRFGREPTLPELAVLRTVGKLADANERGHGQRHDRAVERLHQLAERHGAELLTIRSWIAAGESPACGRTLADLLAWCALTEEPE